MRTGRPRSGARGLVGATLVMVTVAVGSCSGTGAPATRVTPQTVPSSSSAPDQTFASAADSSSPQLDAYAARADQICLYNYRLGLAGERRAERAARARGWSAEQAEAAIRYAWADALANQQRMLEELGRAPERAAAMRRWVRTSGERSRIYRAIGDAWLHAGDRERGRRTQELELAKQRADTLAQWMPFQICGTGGGTSTGPSRSEQLAHPSRRYTAEIDGTSRDLLDVGTKVYWYHEVAGRVNSVADGEETTFVTMTIKPAYTLRMIDNPLRLYRGTKDPSASWLAIVPKRYQSTQPLSKPGG